MHHLRVASTSVAAFFFSLIPLAYGHVFMQHPLPFLSQLANNGPISVDGSDWPCKGVRDYEWSGISNIWPRGSVQYLQAMGGSSHGGGSCQISVTQDLKPTRASQWRVIHSIEGGCPIRNLTEVNYGESPTVLLPNVYNFTVPAWLPIGPAVMAWTWYNRWGDSNVFMNCAPVVVMGYSDNANVPEDDQTAKFWEAPLVFEANNGNGCWTQNKGSCVKFPEPGESLVRNDECPLDESLMFMGTCQSGKNKTGGRGWWRRSLEPSSCVFLAILFVVLMLRFARKWRNTGYV